MSRILYDLTGTEDRRFSPYCWRAKLAMALKDVAYETKAVRFTDIDALSDGPRLTLPTLDDGDKRITDSAAIAGYLEENYTSGQSLFPTGPEIAAFAQAWADTAVNPALIRVILLDVYNALDAENQAYFRESREKRFGTTLEAFAGDRAANLKAFRQTLQPLRGVVANQPFLSGAAPGYADFCPASALLWAAAIGVGGELLEDGDPVAAWLDRVVKLLDKSA